MPVLINSYIKSHYPASTKIEKLPVVSEEKLQWLKNKYGAKNMAFIYNSVEKEKASYEFLSKWFNWDVKDIEQAYEGYKETHEIGYTKQPIIWVPAWNDVIHLVDEKSLPEAEQLKRMLARIEAMKRSPTPQIARDIATIMVVLDNIQDFTTLGGVSARMLERALKLPNILSKGTFAVGEALNAFNVINKIPFNNMGNPEIKKMIKAGKIDVEALSVAELNVLKRELNVMNPKFNALTKAEQKRLMNEHFSITRERWGQPLKAKKRMLEDYLIKTSPLSKMATSVDRRLARVLPNQYELIEHAQSTDNIAGVGLCLGPLLGLVQDVIFGVSKGATLKFKPWSVNAMEKAALAKPAKWAEYLYYSPSQLVADTGSALGDVAYAMASGEGIGATEFVKAAYVGAQGFLAMSWKQSYEASMKIGEAIYDEVWGTGERTSELTKEALAACGINHTREEGFPGVDIPIHATIRQIADAYSEKIPEVIRHFQKELSGTNEGDFLNSCLDCIAKCTCGFLGEKGATTTVTPAKEITVLTRAVDYNLEPPLWATDEEVLSWHTYIMDNVRYFDQDGPRYDLLLNAKKIFWPELIVPE